MRSAGLRRGSCTRVRERTGGHEEILKFRKGSSALFVDDQLDHLLLAIKNPRIKGFLASWGYVKEEWKTQNIVEVLTREELFRLIRTF